MNRQEIISQLKDIAQEAEQDKDTMAAAAVLYCLCGAMKQGKELEMMQELSNFNQRQINELNNIKAQQN